MEVGEEEGQEAEEKGKKGFLSPTPHPRIPRQGVWKGKRLNPPDVNFPAGWVLKGELEYEIDQPQSRGTLRTKGAIPFCLGFSSSLQLIAVRGNYLRDANSC